MKYGWTSSTESRKCVKCGKKTSECRTIQHGAIEISIAVCHKCDYMVYPGRVPMKMLRAIKEASLTEY